MLSRHRSPSLYASLHIYGGLGAQFDAVHRMLLLRTLSMQALLPGVSEAHGRVGLIADTTVSA